MPSTPGGWHPDKPNNQNLVAGSLGAFEALPILRHFRTSGSLFGREQDGDFKLGLGGGFQFPQPSVKNGHCAHPARVTSLASRDGQCTTGKVERCR